MTRTARPRLTLPHSTARSPHMRPWSAPVTQSSAGNGRSGNSPHRPAPAPWSSSPSPSPAKADDLKAVRQILERGGRVLATGFWGGFLLPAGETPAGLLFAACKLDPEGLDVLAGSGEVWMVPEASWQLGSPAVREQYSCAGQPAVLEYEWGKGHAVWWASSTPLENGSSGARAKLRPAAQLDRSAPGKALLLGRVAARRGPLHVELRQRPGPAPAGDWAAAARLAGALQLQPPQRAGSRTACARALHAHRIP